LPKVELMGGQAGGVLTLRRLVDSPADIEEACRKLQEESEQFLFSFLGDSGAGESNGGKVPKTKVETGEGEWTRMVQSALDRISQGDLSKVVMARALTVAFPEEIDPVAVAMSLWDGNPGAHVFLFEPSEGHALVGAAPETVATVASGTFQATAVAGSIPRGDTQEEQTALAGALLNSEKDLREHRVCVEDMVARLETVSEEIQAEEEPHVLTLSAIQHLETLITSRLRNDETVLSSLRALHPTPAVCGFPRDRALSHLAESEPFSRGWYAGPVGWFDGEGDGVFVPALRSAVGSGKEWRLFAGAGIVAGSDPEKEWAETRIKFQPVLRALSGKEQESPGVISRVLEGWGDS
jgi:menaquinone-specific isochorismate synthase